MTAPHTWARQPGWQYFTIAWYLIWPGWLIGWLFTLFVPMPLQQATMFIMASIAVSEYLRPLSVPRKTFQYFRVAPVSARDAVRIAALLVAFQVFLIAALYLIASLIDPSASPQGGFGRALGIPWMFTAFSAVVLGSGRFGIRIQLIPRKALP